MSKLQLRWKGILCIGDTKLYLFVRLCVITKLHVFVTATQKYSILLWLRPVGLRLVRFSLTAFIDIQDFQ